MSKVKSGAIKWVSRNIRQYKFRIAVLSGINIVTGSVGAALALVCKFVIDSAVNGDMNGIITNTLIFLAVILVQFGLNLFSMNMQEYIRIKVMQSLQSSMLYKIEHKSYDKISTVHSGVIMTHLFSDVSVIAGGVSSILPNLLNVITRLVCSLVLLFYFDWFLGTVCLVAGVVSLVFIMLLQNKIKLLHKGVQKQAGRLRSVMQEIVSKLLLIKIFGAEDVMHQEAEKREEDYFLAQIHRRRYAINANNAIGLIFKAGYAVLIIWGALGLFYGTVSYGTIIAAMQLSTQIQTPFSSLSGFAPQLAEMIASAERLMDIDNWQDETQNTGNAQKLYSDLSHIAIKNVSFKYNDDKENDMVLLNASLNINKGDFVGVTGASGGGKSTLFFLLLGIYPVTQGSMLFCSSNGSTLPPGGESRSLFAYVPQGNCLFMGTVAENISFFHKNIDEKKLEQAAKTACADKFINELPKGMNTQIGENGLGISVGQAQRIAVARALYSGAPVLLLDEATSALDAETEKKLLQNISALKDKTCIIVTHRPQALKICNKIIELNQQGELNVK